MEIRDHFTAISIAHDSSTFFFFRSSAVRENVHDLFPTIRTYSILAHVLCRITNNAQLAIFSYVPVHEEENVCRNLFLFHTKVF